MEGSATSPTGAGRPARQMGPGGAAAAAAEKSRSWRGREAAAKVPVRNRNLTAARPSRDSRPRTGLNLDAKEWAGLVAVALVVVLLAAMPLRIYFQQRAELARTSASIAAQRTEIENVLDELEKLENPQYQKEQARRRLGVIEPGETAYRIQDPALGENPESTLAETIVVPPKVWYRVLWDSIASTSKPPLVDVPHLVHPVTPDPVAGTSQLPTASPPPELPPPVAEPQNPQLPADEPQEPLADSVSN